MNYGDITLFSLIQHKMEYLSQRQALLAQNVANIDTPAYKPQDVEKPDFDALVNPTLQKIALRMTSPMHQAAQSSGGGTYKQISREGVFETNFNKNQVSLEEEMQKLSSTQMDYQMATNIYRKTVDMFKTALGRSGGA